MKVFEKLNLFWKKARDYIFLSQAKQHIVFNCKLLIALFEPLSAQSLLDKLGCPLRYSAV
jgi:hypothetical protein